MRTRPPLPLRLGGGLLAAALVSSCTARQPEPVTPALDQDLSKEDLQERLEGLMIYANRDTAPPGVVGEIVRFQVELADFYARHGDVDKAFADAAHVFIQHEGAI